MCISLIAFNVIFKKHPFEEKEYKPDYFSEKLMYPRFKDLLDVSFKYGKEIKSKQYEQLIIKSSDNFNLVGYLFKNQKATNNTAIFVHGYQSSGFKDNSQHAIKYLEKGFNVLLIDNRASGQSEGKYTTFGIKESEDTLLWCNKIADLFPNGNIIIHGTSLGGATTCMMSNKNLPKDVKCLVSDCSFINIESEFKHMMGDLFKIPTWPELNLIEKWAKKLAGFDFTTKSPINSVKESKLPILFIHGKEDQFISPNNAIELYNACNSEKDILLVNGCGHAESQLETDTYYNKIFNFINNYI